MTIFRQGLVQLGTKVLPVQSASFDPAILETAYRSSGDNYSTLRTVFGATPAMQLTVPYQEAVDELGLIPKRYTALTYTALKYNPTTGITSTGSDHITVTLSASCFAFAMITGFNVSQNGIATATIQVMAFSADGTTHPLTVGTGSALALASQPVLKTLGGVTINGAAIGGAQSVSGSLSQRAQPLVTDGDLYPTQFSWSGNEKTLSIQHSDPSAVLSALGLLGADIASSTTVTLNTRSSAGVITTTGASTITIAKGRAIPTAVSGAVGSMAQTSITIVDASTNGITDGWTLS